jgi:ribonuclease P protein component
VESNQPKHKFKAIKRTFEFESIYKNGKKVRLSNWLMVIFTDNTEDHLSFDIKSQNSKLKKSKSVETKAVVDREVLNKNETSYYGITASRKVGKAVLRNKLKRWVRNSAAPSTWPKKLLGKRSVFIFRPQGKDFYDKVTLADFKTALENLR